MTHTPEVIETKELNDEQVSYKICCCDDATTDSWHTFSVTVPDIDAHLEERKTDAAARHEAKLQWRQKQTAAAVQGATP